MALVFMGVSMPVVMPVVMPMPVSVVVPMPMFAVTVSMAILTVGLTNATVDEGVAVAMTCGWRFGPIRWHVLCFITSHRNPELE